MRRIMQFILVPCSLPMTCGLCFSGDAILKAVEALGSSPTSLFCVKLPSETYRIPAEFLVKDLSRSVSVEGTRSGGLYSYLLGVADCAMA